MSEVITGIKAVRKAKELNKLQDTKVVLSACIHTKDTSVQIFEFLGEYFLFCMGPEIELSFFEKITKEEAANIEYNISGVAHIGTCFEFGGF